MKRELRALSILAMAILVNIPATAAISPAAFKKLEERALKNGKDGKPIVGQFAKDLGVAEGDAKRSETVLSESAVDGKNHQLSVTLHDGTAQYVVLVVNQNTQTISDTTNYRIQSDGKIATAVRIVVRLESGQAVPGSGSATQLDPNSTAITAAVQHELDFWLKGKYRKHRPRPATPQSMPAPEPAKP